jgi:L-lactate utilization protein LutC
MSILEIKQPIEKKLMKYKFPKNIVERIKSVIELLSTNQLQKFEMEIAKLALEMCEKVERKNISPKQADDHFTLLDLYLDDNYCDIELDEKVKDILFEGMVFHDIGKDYGANINTIRRLSEEILRKEG